MVLSLNKDCGPDISTNFYVQSGKFEVDMETSWGSGVVTAITLLSAGASSDKKKDEVDMEFVGSDVTTVQTTYFVDGVHVPGATESVDFHVASNTSSSRHVYGMEYTPDSISWFIDGRKVKTVSKIDGVAFPSKPVDLDLSLWDGTDFSEWAGKINWDAAPDQTYYANVYSIKITQNSCEETAEESGSTPVSTNSSTSTVTAAFAVNTASAADIQSISASASANPQATTQVSANVNASPPSTSTVTAAFAVNTTSAADIQSISASASAQPQATTQVSANVNASPPSTSAATATSSASYAWIFTCTIALVILTI
ncbi:unnamed protein product [Umbelopsis ramanniana]